MLRDYQIEICEKVNEAFKAHRSVMVQMPTGTGKTVVLASLVQQFLHDNTDSAVVIVAHRKELVEQIQNTLKTAHISVMSIQWLSRNIDMVRKKPDLVIIDEAHHALAKTYQMLWTAWPEAKFLGLTATPYRMSGDGFTDLFEVLVDSWSVKQFIADGWLSPYDYYSIRPDSEEQKEIDSLKKRGADGDFQMKELREKLDVRPSIERLYESFERFAFDKKGIVYAIDIAHAEHIAEFFREQGVAAYAISSKTPAKERAEVIRTFKDENRIQILVSVDLFSEGFDCPDVEFIQMARPTLSLAKYLQMVGRGLRINHENKDKVCMIIDNVGNYRKFGLPDKPRNWESMFAGLRAGKGIIPTYVKKIQNIIAVNDEMVTVKKANTARKKMTAKQLKEYLKNVEPFQQDGRWGLKVMNDIIVKPIYAHISNFRGDYAQCRIGIQKCLYGLLDRRGNIILPPEYKYIYGWNEHAVEVKGNDGYCRTIEL